MLSQELLGKNKQWVKEASSFQKLTGDTTVQGTMIRSMIFQSYIWLSVIYIGLE